MCTCPLRRKLSYCFAVGSVPHLQPFSCFPGSRPRDRNGAAETTDRPPSTAALPATLWSWCLLSRPTGAVLEQMDSRAFGLTDVLLLTPEAALIFSLLRFVCCHLCSRIEVGKGCYSVLLTNFGCFFSFLCNVLTSACVY